MSQPIQQTSPARRVLVVAVALFSLLTAVVAVQPVAAQEVNAPVQSQLCGEPGDITVRLYRLFFNRTPDADGLRYWSDIYLQTGDVKTVAYWMAQSTEYTNLWSGADDAAYVEGLLYNNLLDRPSEPGGFNYWVSLLDGTAEGRNGQKLPRDEMAVFWVIQPELTTKHPVTQHADCALLDQIQDIPGGRALEVDFATTNIQASPNRCGVASINANWVHRDGAVPFSEHIGFANIDGVNVPSRGPSPGVAVNANTNWGDDNARGILGLRRDDEGGTAAEFQHTFDPSVGALNILSNGPKRGNATLQLHANYWDDTPGHQFYDPAKFDNKFVGWEWAVGGITMVVNGQKNAVTAGQDYTFNTTRHSFAAFNSSNGKFMFGSTTTMTADQMVNWLMGQGYNDIMKMDGGGSVEFNEARSATVAGTQRPLSVWLGVGC